MKIKFWLLQYILGTCPASHDNYCTANKWSSPTLNSAHQYSFDQLANMYIDNTSMQADCVNALLEQIVKKAEVES